MALSFDFELGIWNAWILQVIYFIVSMFPLFFKSLIKSDIKNDVDKLKNISPTNVKKTLYSMLLYWMLFIIFIISFLITFFLPLKFDTNWFYVGIFLFFIGVFILVFVIRSWISTQPSHPITLGIYRYSRHPMYLSFFFSYIGISIASLSLIFLVITIIHITLTFFQAKSEEKYCILTYGRSYQEYMERTPRWIGFPKKEKKF
jgi:protein-S-isoprenylcysteine O-methyltransferase Ste14